MSNRIAVRDYLVTQCGVYKKTANELCDKHKDIIEKGDRLGSFPYYVAGEILKATPESGDMNWEGFDPDWEEPEEEDEDLDP